MKKTDVLIIGASASGLMCAIEAAKRGRSVVVLDHARKPGNKIRMSGGGRCNFTNYTVDAENYLSNNVHFCKSAISRFTQWDFIALVHKYNIPYHERDHGQLFCDETAKDILDMLLAECELYKVTICLKTEITKIEKQADNHYRITSSRGDFHCQSIVIATGGLSIPTMGATPFGYKIAEQFGIKVWPTKAGLVPFTLQPEDKARFSPLSGIAIESVITYQDVSFRENLLFTHRGLSGPVVLQVSSYWQPGSEIQIDLLPDNNLLDELVSLQATRSQAKLKNVLADYLPKRVIATFLDEQLLEKSLQNISHSLFEEVADALHSWRIKPNGTEGYRTAEVTVGGVDCNAVSSKTMEANEVKGLYFVGEVLDVTGWLGGYNFQWAWSSGWCAGQYV